MKHISEFIASKKVQFEHIRQLSMFAIPSSKGSNEWRLFGSPVVHDRVDAYKVTAPRKLTLSRFHTTLSFNPQPHTLKYAR